jgi:manganese/zinc/iron transport system permease protein
MTWEFLGLTGRNLQSAVTIIGIAAATNAACALVGCYLILRRMSLLGDAIAHAVLPGLVLAYVFSGSLSLPALYLGAVLTGLVTAALTQTLHRYGGVAEDTSMGVVFTSLFALGVVLIKLFGHHVDFDPDCVLSGLLELADDNLVSVGELEVPRGLVTVLPVLGMNLAVILIFWKELLVASFDPGFASAVGFRPGVLHYVLMALVAVTTVASFEQVGSILVIAMLIVPGATAHLLTDRLATMLATAVVLGVLCAVLGFVTAVWWDVSIAGAMTVVAGGFYLLAALLSPSHGLVWRWLRQLELRLRIAAEDVLAILFRAEEVAPGLPVELGEIQRRLGRGPMLRAGVWLAVLRGWARRKAGYLELLPDGRRYAQQVIRSHRLWETFEVVELGRPAERVHDSAMRIEHFLSPQLREELTSIVGDSPSDPHGKQIPQGPEGESLT